MTIVAGPPVEVQVRVNISGLSSLYVMPLIVGIPVWDKYIYYDYGGNNIISDTVNYNYMKAATIILLLWMTSM